jgi:hypothetical protein
MFDFINYREFLEYEINKYKENSNKDIKKLCDIFLKCINDIEFKDYDNLKDYEKNIVDLEINAFFIIKEIIDNIILKNIGTVYSNCRSLLENVYIIKFLKMSDKYTNEVFYDYGKIKFIVLNDFNEIEKFEQKYDIKIKENQSNQWIEIVNKHNNYKNKKGFASILKQVNDANKGNKEYENIYRAFCNFIHITEDGFLFKAYIYNDTSNEYKIYFEQIIKFTLYQLRNLIFESLDVLDKNSEGNKNLYKIVKEIEEF